MISSIRWKLAGSLLLIVLVSVGLTAFLISQGTQREFRQYISECDMMYCNQLQNNLSDYYASTGSWDGVQDLLNHQITTANHTLVLSDINGLVLADTGSVWIGKNVNELGLSEPIVVKNNGIEVGRVFSVCYACYAATDEVSVMGNRCADSTVLTVTESNFINRVNDFLWIGGIIGAVVALVLGLVLTRQITLPLITLKQGAQQIAGGNLGFRVKADSRDEFGTVAQSFNTMAENLNKIDQSRRQLTADIAHELRTPLTVIDGTVQGIMFLSRMKSIYSVLRARLSCWPASSMTCVTCPLLNQGNSS